MRRVFLGGTTTGTTWRLELIKRLVARGVREDQIINPHLPAGVSWTPEHMRVERKHKDDLNTIVLIVLCPAVVDDPSRRELLGPTSMFEVGRFAYSAPGRTAIVLQPDLFKKGGRSREVLEGLITELRKDFGGRPPYFATLEAAEDWLVKQLANR
jgi:hypothetical protein